MNGPPPLPLIPYPSWVGSPAPATGGGTTPPTPPVDPDVQKLKDIKDLLKDSATGAAAVKYLEDKAVKVDFVTGGGSYWDGTRIVIDRGHSTERAALTLVHEVNHTEATLEGTGANIDTDTRADYVSKMLKEEVGGTVESIQAKNELVAAGKSISATFPLEAEYNKAYKDAVDAAKAADASASAETLKAAGEKAGSEAVMKGFNDGKVVTSNTSEKYPDYYGKAWDGKHPTPPAPPAP
jgi:hypothetical protein